MIPNEMPNDALAAQYRDLLEDDPDAAELLPLIATLDALYAAPAPVAIREGQFAPAALDADGPVMTLDDELPDALPPTPATTAPMRPRRAQNLRRGRSHRWQGFAALAAAVLVVALMAVVLHALAPGGAGSEAAQRQFARLGGTRIVLSDTGWYFPPPGLTVNARAIYHAEEPLLQARFAYALGVSDPVFSQPDNDHLVIDLPGVSQQQWAEVRALLAPGQVDAYVTTTAVPIGTQGEGMVPGVQAFTGDDVDRASVAPQTDPQSGQPIVLLTLKPAPRAAFALLTERHIGGDLTVYLDSTVVESATLMFPIDGQMQVFGFANPQAARNFAAFLKYGRTQPGGIQSMTYVAPTA